MPNRIHLELIRDTLANAVAILSYSGNPARRLTAARGLLQLLGREHMPTSIARDQWALIAQSMLRIGGTATSDELRTLSHQVQQLHDLVDSYLSRTAD